MQITFHGPKQGDTVQIQQKRLVQITFRPENYTYFPISHYDPTFGG